MKRFMLYPIIEISPKFLTQRDKAVKERSRVSFIHFPTRDIDISTWRGSGLFIFVLGVWRCLNDDKLNIVPRFFFIFLTAEWGTHEAHIYSMLMGKRRHTMKNKVRLLVALLCLCSVGGLSATDKESTTLKVNLKDGTSKTYVLEDNAKITFEDANMCFSSRDWKFEIPLSELSTWTYDSPLSAIDNATMDDITVNQSGNIITVCGDDRNMNIDVYATDGKLLQSIKSSSNRHEIPTDGWIPGVYLIKVGHSTFKIVKL